MRSSKHLLKVLCVCAILLCPAAMHAQFWCDSYIAYDSGWNEVSGYSRTFFPWGTAQFRLAVESYLMGPSGQLDYEWVEGPALDEVIAEVSGIANQTGEYTVWGNHYYKEEWMSWSLVGSTNDSSYVRIDIPEGEESVATGQWNYYAGIFYATLLPPSPAYDGNSVSEIVATLVDSCAQQDPNQRYKLQLTSGSTWWVGNPQSGAYGYDQIGVQDIPWVAYYSQLIRDGAISPCGWYGTQNMSYSRRSTGGSYPYDFHTVALTLDGASVTAVRGNANQSTVAPYYSRDAQAARTGRVR